MRTMSKRSPRWLTTLRHWRYTILCAALPAVLASVLSAGACAAMSPMPGPAHVATATAAEHEHDHHAAAHDGHAADELPAPCPHCPLEGGAANVAFDECAADEERSGPAPSVELPVPPRLAASTPAIPPLIRAAPARASPPPPLISLNLRYCVLLI